MEPGTRPRHQKVARPTSFHDKSTRPERARARDLRATRPDTRLLQLVFLLWLKRRRINRARESGVAAARRTTRSEKLERHRK